MSGHGMIHARIDTVLLNHPKAFDAGPEAMGIWLFAVLHARFNEQDGDIPATALRQAWGGKRNAKLIAKLIAVGLLRHEGDRYIVIRYSPKNQTKAEIEAKREAGRERKRDYDQRQRFAHEVTRYERVSAPTELELEERREEKRERRGRATPEPPPPGSVHPWGQTSFAPWTLATACGVYPELSAEAVTPVWVNFVGFMSDQHRGRRPITPSAWQRWVSNERRFQTNSPMFPKSTAPTKQAYDTEDPCLKAF